MLCKAQAHVITPRTTVRKQKTIYSSLLTYLAMFGLLCKIINNLLPQPHKQFVTKYTHFITYPLVVLVWSPFFIIHGMTSEVPNIHQRFWFMLTWRHHAVAADLSANWLESPVLPHPRCALLDNRLDINSLYCWYRIGWIYSFMLKFGPFHLNVPAESRLIRPGNIFQSSMVQFWWAHMNCSLSFPSGLLLLEPI